MTDYISYHVVGADPLDGAYGKMNNFMDKVGLDIEDVKLGIAQKREVRVSTTETNITLSGLQTIDGVTLIAGDKVLVKDQTNKVDNGIYDVSSGAWMRSIDTDGTPSGEVQTQMYVFVREGTKYTNAGFTLTTPNPITVGTSDLTFIQSSGAGQITASGGLVKDGSILSIQDGGVTDTKIGNRTVDQAASPTGNVGTLTSILSWFASKMKGIMGTSNWFDSPPTNLQNAKTHMDDTTVHVTAANKVTWDSKADATALTNHTSDTVVHVTAIDKTNWNGKADASALSTHTADTTIHVTTTDKTNWNGKQNALPITITKSGTAPANPVVGDEWIDTTTSRKKYWNNTVWVDPLKYQ